MECFSYLLVLNCQYEFRLHLSFALDGVSNIHI
uniref:Uncharacterized protein n=1 Tax=Arundo donax TaxID=35708 RepID=A0A0A9C6X1_ARUDO